MIRDSDEILTHVGVSHALNKASLPYKRAFIEILFIGSLMGIVMWIIHCV